jgi:glycerol kinase
MPELLLAIDVGTSSLGVGVFSPGGELLGPAGRPVRSASPAPGLVEQDAAAVWRGVRGLIRQALAKADRQPHDIAAVGITTQRASAVIWDRVTGVPFGPMVVWSDLRGVARSAELRRAGYGVAPQMAAAKLEGMIASEPGARAAMAAGRLAFGNIDAFLIFKLSGGRAHATDRSQAWPMGYLDMQTLSWSQALIEMQGLDPAIFPALVDTWGTIGTTSRAAFGAEVPIAAVIADQQSALFAHGDGPGTAKCTYGTSAVVNLDTGGAVIAQNRSMPPFVLSMVQGRPRFCLEGMVFSAGSTFDWMRGTLGLGDRARFEALAASAPDTAGAYVLPALQGLGAPHGDPARRAAIGGLSAAVGKGHLARAAMEGLAFRVREIVDEIYAISGTAPPEALGVDGGMTANQTFMQIQADLLGRAVKRHAIREATLCGAAICAGRGAGVLSGSDAAGFVRYDRTFEPRIAPDAAAERLAAWKAQVYG